MLLNYDTFINPIAFYIVFIFIYLFIYLFIYFLYIFYIYSFTQNGQCYKIWEQHRQIAFCLNHEMDQIEIAGLNNLHYNISGTTRSREDNIIRLKFIIKNVSLIGDSRIHVRVKYNTSYWIYKPLVSNVSRLAKIADTLEILFHRNNARPSEYSQ